MNRANVGMPLHVSAKQMLRSDLGGGLEAKQVTVRIAQHGAKSPCSNRTGSDRIAPGF